MYQWILWGTMWREVGYALPLIVSISLVYAATRHELFPAVLRRASRVGLWISVFLAVTFAVLQALAARL